MGEETDGKAAKGNFPDSENIIKLDFVDGCTTKYWMYTLNEYSLWYVNYISKWAYLGEKKMWYKEILVSNSSSVVISVFFEII